jgi:hypothetical protein
MASESLKVLLEKVHAGKIVLPEFQRDFVWPQSAVIRLMTSIFNGYPIGSLLLMENNDAYSYRAIDGAQVPNTKHVDQDLILDGQQRVTSCYRAFYGTLAKEAKSPGRYYFKYGDYVKLKRSGIDPDGSTIEDLFEFIKPPRVQKSLPSMAAEISLGLLPLDIILQEPRGYNYAKWFGQYNFSEAQGDSAVYEKLVSISSDFQTAFVERVTGYQVNYEKITRDTNPDVICTIFETINTTGVKLTVFDLLVAKCFKKGVNLRDKLDGVVETRKWISRFDPTGKDIATVQLPRILGQLIKRECKKGVILELDAADISNQWFTAVEGLEKALEALHSRYGAVTAELIPSSDIIAPLAVILVDPRFRDIHKDSLDIWYWRSIFGQYFRGAPETKIARTVREITSDDGWLAGGTVEPDAVASFQFPLSSLDDATKNTTVYKALLTLMISQDPCDIGYERRRLREISDGEIHDHHVFPQKFLHDNGVKGTSANQVLNRMPIWKTTNERISSYAPNVYLADFTKCHSEVGADLAKFYGIDIAFLKDSFSKDQYDLFLLDRKDKFLSMIAESTKGLIGEQINRVED